MGSVDRFRVLVKSHAFHFAVRVRKLNMIVKLSKTLSDVGFTLAGPAGPGSHPIPSRNDVSMLGTANHYIYILILFEGDVFTPLPQKSHIRTSTAIRDLIGY